MAHRLLQSLSALLRAGALCLACGFTGLAGASASAAAPAAAGPPWDLLATTLFQHIGLEQGLPNLMGTALAEDADGMIWIGTQGGLARWDGYRSHNYTPAPNDPNSLRDSAIVVLRTDRQRRLWVGTNSGGLARYDAANDRFIRIPVGPQGTAHPGIMDVAADAGDGIWVASRGGLDHLDANGVVLAQLRHDPAKASSLPDPQVRALLRDRDGRLWVGTAKGVALMEPDGVSFRRIPLPTRSGPHVPVRSMLQSADGRIWIGTRQEGVYVLDPAAPMAAQAQAGTAGDIVSFIREVSPGKLWFGAVGRGIVTLDTANGRIGRIHHDEGIAGSLLDDNVLDLLRDRAGLVWAATDRGIDRHDPNHPDAMNLLGGIRKTGLNDRDVTSVMQVANGDVWLGLKRKGIDIVSAGTGAIVNLAADAQLPEKALPAEHLNAMTAPVDGIIYAGSARGLYQVGQATLAVQRVHAPPRHPAADVTALRRDGQRLWVGGNDGLWTIDLDGRGPLEAKRLPGTERLNTEIIVVFERDREGRLWIGTRNNGLYRYDPASASLLHVSATSSGVGSLSSGYVSALMFDRAGRLWIGTQGGGIHVLANPANPADSGAPQLRRIGIGEGLPNNMINKLVEDRAGVVWAATDDGMARIDAATFTARALQRAQGVAIASHWLNSGAVTANGDLLFGGVGGLTVIRPSLEQPYNYRPPVVVTEAQIGAVKIAPGSLNHRGAAQAALPVAPDANRISIEFAALDYSAPERNRHAYRLDGYDKDWVLAHPAHRLATYANLAPGEYTLRLRGSNRDGVWTERELALPIKVLPSWQQTWWFRLIPLLAILAAVYALSHGRTRYLRRRKHLLELQVRLRTHALRQKRAELVGANEELALSVDTLRKLGESGRDITARLDPMMVFASLHRHAARLLDAPEVALHRVSADGAWLCALTAPGDTVAGPQQCVAIDGAEALVAKVAREADLAAPSGATGSTLCGPLLMGQRVLGVMTVRTPTASAYGEREQLIFRTLCAYGAVALDNAEAYRQLAETLATLGTTQAQMVQQAKIASLGTLTAGIAHEINNPANFVHAGSQNLRVQLARFDQFLRELAGPGLTPDMARHFDARFAEMGSSLDVVAEGAVRIRDVVRDFRIFSRLDEADWKETAIAESVSATVNLVRMQYAAEVDIVCRLDANPVLLCWPAQLNQVFMNLVVNACQAIAARPAAERAAQPGRLTVRSRIERPWLVLEFDDNGCGMSEETVQRMFDPFYTTKDVQEGMGMGLSIVRGIIDKHQGQIAVRTAPGAGTCFTLRLPLAGGVHPG